MEIATHGVMRGGIHVVHGWIVSKFKTKTVRYYNNIRDVDNLSDRLIPPQDTRVEPIQDKLIPKDADTIPQLILKSFESKPLKMYTNPKSKHVIVLRNPYNNLASSIAYLEARGTCPDISDTKSFDDLWKLYARECLFLTSHLPNKVVLLYDLFIANESYRREKSIQLGLSPDVDLLVTLHMGGGSSFPLQTGSHYLNRFSVYNAHPSMKRLFADSDVKILWEQLLSQEQYYLSQEK